VDLRWVDETHFEIFEVTLCDFKACGTRHMVALIEALQALGHEEDLWPWPLSQFEEATRQFDMADGVRQLRKETEFAYRVWTPGESAMWAAAEAASDALKAIIWETATSQGWFEGLAENFWPD
jgi:hypothetical protein